jgi:hypothetical protein
VADVEIPEDLGEIVECIVNAAPGRKPSAATALAIADALDAAGHTYKPPDRERAADAIRVLREDGQLIAMKTTNGNEVLLVMPMHAGDFARTTLALIDAGYTLQDNPKVRIA